LTVAKNVCFRVNNKGFNRFNIKDKAMVREAARSKESSSMFIAVLNNLLGEWLRVSRLEVWERDTIWKDVVWIQGTRF